MARGEEGNDLEKGISGGDVRSGIRRNRRGRWCEKGVKDSDDIPDKEIHHSQGYCTVCGPVA